MEKNGEGSLKQAALSGMTKNLRQLKSAFSICLTGIHLGDLSKNQCDA